MDEIAFNCLRLRKLKWCLRRGLCRLLRQCSDLENIKLGRRGNCHRMLLSVCHSVKDLKLISIHDVIPFDEGEPVVDDLDLSLWGLCSCFPCLTIDLTWCCFITDDALLAISLCCPDFRSRYSRSPSSLSWKAINSPIGALVQHHWRCAFSLMSSNRFLTFLIWRW